MNPLERFYKIDQLPQEQTVVSRATFPLLARTSVSR